jgi:peptide/nickel transport system substrate-binding protein
MMNHPFSVLNGRPLLGLVALVALMGMVAFACGDDEEDEVAGLQGGDLRIMMNGAIPGFDPHIASVLEANLPTSSLYSNLVRNNTTDPDEIVSDVADTWEVSGSGLTYTFFLQKDVKWSDGEKLTSEDVVFSVNRMIEPEQPRPRTGLLRGPIKSVEAVDGDTVRVTLNSPSASFLPLLAVGYMKIMPKHVIEAGVDMNLWENVVGSGPFVTDELKRGNSWRHVRNPDYFKKGRPFVDSLSGFIISDPGTYSAAFIAGQLDISAPGHVSPETIESLEGQLEGEYSVYPLQGNTAGFHLIFNTEKAPWDDLRVIRALRLATNQWEIQEAIGAGNNKVGAPFSLGTFWSSSVEELKQYPGYGGCPGCPRTKEEDIALAKELLKEAGYDPPSELGKRTLSAATILWFADQTQLWAEQMRKNLGLDIEVKMVDLPTSVSMWTSGDFDIGQAGYGVNIADPNDYVGAIYGPGDRNWTGWRNSEFLALFDQQSTEMDLDKRKATLREMEEFLLTKEDPYLWMQWVSAAILASDKIKTEAGAFVAPGSTHVGYEYEDLWLEK